MMREPDYGVTGADQLEERIRYAQSWEDPVTVCEGLRIDSASRVLAIASGGDNCLAMLLRDAASVEAVDMSAAQIALLEIKVRAIEQLSHHECMSFLGVSSSPDRFSTYTALRCHLSSFAREYWDRRRADISRGVIHCGKFEQYFAIFRRFMLPLMQTPGTVRTLLSSVSTEEQNDVYRTRWDNPRWRAMFRLFFSRYLLGRLGRDSAFFAQVDRTDIAAELLLRTRRGLTAVPITDNYFVQYILTGHFRDSSHAHPWMHSDTYDLLRERCGRLRCRVGRMGEGMERHDSVPTALYCSDIFEYMPQEDAHTVMQSLTDAAAPGVRLLYYSLFVPRSLPQSLTHDTGQAATLFARDRTFFYDSITIGLS